MELSPRFDQALQYATLIHAGQRRKGTEVPYVGHLLGVASIVIDDGGSEDEAIGALLHDAAEDAGGKGRLADIRSRFGEVVASIVAACTDTVETPKPEWRKRKEDYIAHVAKASAAALRVSAADKLHNARSVLADYRKVGESLWERFTGKKDGTLWYYRSMVAVLRKAGGGAIVEELDRVVTELERVAGKQA
ncbi:MAG: HD domain-containing protein [Planctomycetes bacterium]|nr:HD domain-containing protein [Planctomycetota bacterium]